MDFTLKKQIKRILILGLGWFFIILGFIGLFFPILQGILFLLIGLYLLSLESKIVRKLIDKLKERYPSFGSCMEKAKEKVRDLKERVCG